jgi:hypothetical protein
MPADRSLTLAAPKTSEQSHDREGVAGTLR